MALDFQVQDGGGLATVTLYVRNRERRLIGAAVNVGKGQASLFQTIDGEQTDLAYRDSLDDMVQPDGWNRLAVRVYGNEMWLLLNDQPALYASGVMADSGSVGLRLLREGRVTDETGTIVVFRDLTLTTIEGADPSRAPTHP